MTRFEQAGGSPDAAEILNSIGEAAYEWRLDTDALVWVGNVAAVLGARHGVDISSGRAFAARVEAGDGRSRHDVIEQGGRSDQGAGVPYQVQYAFKRVDSAAKTWLEDTGRWFAGPDGKPLRAHGVVRVVDAGREREERLTRLATSDPLTGAITRARLTEALEATLEAGARLRGSCGFLLVSIDRLGHLNEAYGFDAAEEVIAAVAKRIRARLRGKDHLGRFSGNKFGVILTSCTAEELTIAAERLLAGVRDETIQTSAGLVAATVTIGGVTAPRHARTVAEVYARAFDALHGARKRRHGSFLAYHPNIEREAMRREAVRVTDEIVSALNERRLALAYEPVVDSQNRQVAFHECLMRVQRADGGIAHAHEIIPVAERVGLIRMLDHRVLELVVNELVDAPALRASVNVSPPSAVDPEWWLGLGALLRANRSAAERLIIEITETAAIQDVDDARGFVARVRDLGCRIAIDDFGSGHTSFRNLRRLGVDIVKIDGAFVQNMAKSDDDGAFVRTLIELAHRLKLVTVAEWVQDEEAARMLSEWGCDYLQGALIGLATTHRPWADHRGAHAARA